MSLDQTLETLFITLPEPLTIPDGTAAILSTGSGLTVLGQLPYSEGRLIYKGRVGVELTVDQGRLAIQTAMAQAFGTLRHHLGGSLDTVKAVQWVRIYVASGTEFRDHDRIASAATDWLTPLFGAGKKHGRTTIGVASLPQGAAVMIEMDVIIK